MIVPRTVLLLEREKLMNPNARIGLVLFTFYLLFYSGFVGLNAFVPESMAWIAAAGLNLAILYGFALIVLALVLSVAYGLVCRDSSSDRQE